jgi:putative ABC transport system ATP-binding protein
VVVSSGGLDRPDPSPGDAIIDLADVIRVYRDGDVETIALRGVDLRIAPREFVAIMGRSGSGKTTLLQLLAGSDRPTAGHVVVDGVDLTRATEAERAAVRGRRVAIAFQSENLVPFLSLRENVILAGALASRSIDDASAAAILERTGLGGRGEHRPSQLSGGEQQRAALAVVLAAHPPIVVGDEITGELESASAARLLDLLVEIHAAEGLTVVLATHDLQVARHADRVVDLADGRVVADRRIA